MIGRMAAALVALLMGWATPARGAELLDEKTVLDLAGRELLPETVAELNAVGQKQAAAAWSAAKAPAAVLVWAYVQEGRRLEPTYWLVAIRSGKGTVGLLALDTRTGRLAWRASRIPAWRLDAVDGLFSAPKAAVQKISAAAAPEHLKRCDPAAAMAITVNGRYYWMLPTRDEDVHDSLCLAADGKGAALKLWEAAGQGRGLRPFQGMDVGADVVPDLPPAPSSTDAGVTWMAGEVPLYADAENPVSWAHGLAMVHQWWSPVPLGPGKDQASMLASYLRTAEDEPVYLHQVHQVMRHWHDVGKAGGRKTGFQRFSRTWFGKGAIPGAHVNWKSDDPRAWLAYEAPVLAAVDADGRGPEEPVDHVVALVGFSAAHRMLYVNNPWGLADAFSFDAFADRYWSAWYSVSCDLPSLCATKTWSRRGMVAGTPGDLVGPPTPQPIAAVPQAASDSQVACVSSIGVQLAPPLVEAFGGNDAFGEAYATQCTISVPSATEKGEVRKGGWTDVRTRDAGGTLMIAAMVSDRSLFPGTVVGGGQADVAFVTRQDAQDITVTASCEVFDADDRSHLQKDAAIQVSDDAEKPGGVRTMKKPLLLSRSGETRIPVTVKDDDPAPPIVRLASQDVLYDSQKEAYRFQVRVDDWSGVAEVGVKWSFDGAQPPGDFDAMSKAGDGQWRVDIPRGDWIEHVGERLRFWVSARDADQDWDGDASSTVEMFDVSILDDDELGPTVIQYVVERTEEGNQFQVLVQLADASEILVTESWPKLYYAFSENLSLDHFNGVTKLVRQPRLGPNWFTAVAPWGEEGIEEETQQQAKKKDTVIYFKVRAQDLDNDREKDEADSWSSPWWEVYLAAAVDERKTITDIWPAGANAIVEGIWDHWFELPPQDLTSGMFIEDPPTEETPPAMPDVLPGGPCAVRLHFYLTRLAVAGGVKITLGGTAQGDRSFKVRVSLLSRKGIRVLGDLSYATAAGGGGGEQTLAVPPDALSTGENILVIEPAPEMKPDDRFGVERILIER